MDKERKIKTIIMYVSKMFFAVGREPSAQMLKTFAEQLIHLDLKCSVEAIEEFITDGDEYPTVSKIIKRYDYYKKKNVKKILLDAIEDCKQNRVDKDTFIAMCECITEKPDEKTQEEIYKIYSVEQYLDKRIDRFMKYFKDDLKPRLEVQSDLLKIGGKNGLRIY